MRRARRQVTGSIDDDRRRRADYDHPAGQHHAGRAELAMEIGSAIADKRSLYGEQHQPADEADGMDVDDQRIVEPLGHDVLDAVRAETGQHPPPKPSQSKPASALRPSPRPAGCVLANVSHVSIPPEDDLVSRLRYAPPEVAVSAPPSRNSRAACSRRPQSLCWGRSPNRPRRSRKPAASTSAVSSSGVRNLSQSCVPLGIIPVPSPTVIIASRDSAVRLGVERISKPSVASARASPATNAAGSVTCSITSIDVTRSKVSPASASIPPAR